MPKMSATTGTEMLSSTNLLMGRLSSAAARAQMRATRAVVAEVTWSRKPHSANIHKRTSEKTKLPKNMAALPAQDFEAL